MKIIIIWDCGNRRLLADTIETLVEESQCYLFSVICGGTSMEGMYESAGYQWAIEHGAPVEILVEEDIERLLEKISKTADYLIAYNNGTNPVLRRLIMRFRAEGKHGTIIQGD